jgi:hypothetical protein
MTDTKPDHEQPRAYHKHGLNTAKTALKEWGSRAIDLRTRAGRSLLAWREQLIDDLGGIEQVSAQQLTVLELAARTKILLDGIDAWLFEQPSLINKRERRLFAVVKERQQLADSLARYMGQLGLERRGKIYDLSDYVVENYSEEPDG